MFGFDIAALMGFFGLTGAFAIVAAVLAAWMAWRIVEKTGYPGWMGLGAVLLTLTGIASIVPLVLLWVFAFMRWPRDEPAHAGPGYGAAPAGGPVRPSSPQALPPPPTALSDRRGWRLTGMVSGASVVLAVDGAVASYVLTGAPAAHPGELSVPDPSVGRPHARLLIATGRLGLEDLGTTGGTFIDGARLLPEHGPRDISAARAIRLGSIELVLARA